LSDLDAGVAHFLKCFWPNDKVVAMMESHEESDMIRGDDVDFAPPPMQRHHNQPEEYEEEEPCHIEKGGTEVILSEI